YSGKATDRLQRIYQLDQGQYDAGQYGAYSPSACSAASLTEIFNAWGGNYRIATILSTEISEGVISPSLGLVGNAATSITTVAKRFGFDTQSMSSLGQAIDAANSGAPVMVDILPGAAWPNGHFVVIKSGDSTNVTIADSWSTNFQTISRSRFLN